MQNSDIHNIATFSYDDIPEWEKKVLMEQGFKNLELPILERTGSHENIYNIYTDETESTPIVASSVHAAIESGKIESPYKVININCRIADIIPREELETLKSDETSGEEQSDEEKAVAEKPAEEG